MERLTKNEKILLIVALLIGAIGCIYSIKNYYRAFPEVAIEFKINKSQALNKALEFLKTEGVDLENYHKVVVFAEDHKAKDYLDMELGVEELSRLAKSEINIWSFFCRWFKPLQKEEYNVGFDPNGRLVSYKMEISETAPGPNLSVEKAKSIAEKFLLERLNINLNEYTSVEENQIVRPNRTDWTFVWERKDFKAKEATYRIKVDILGDKIGGYKEFLKVPEAWEREYKKMRSRNELLQLGANFLAVPILLSAIGYFLFKLKILKIKFSVILGGIAAVVIILAGINSIPLMLSRYDTTQPFSSFLITRIFSFILSGALVAAIVIFCGSAGEVNYRLACKDRVFVPHLFSSIGFRTKEFFQAVIYGYIFAIFHIGFVIFFYLATRRIGFWTPAEVRYTDLISTFAPWLYPVLAGFVASVTEEFIFRLFAISYLKRILKSTLLAILISALIFGFLHSNYPQQPAYARGVEVGIIGIIAGILFLRFGILTTLIWHYLVNATFTGILLFQLGGIHHKFSTLITLGWLLIPLGYAIISYFKGQKFIAEPGLFNQNIPTEEKKEIKEISPQITLKPVELYQPLTSYQKRILPILVIVGLIAHGFIRYVPFGKFVRYTISPGKAIKIAEDHMQIQYPGVETKQFSRVLYHIDIEQDLSSFGPDTLIITGKSAANYVYEVSGINKLNSLYPEVLPYSLWVVRCFKPLQKDEYRVYLTPNGEVYSHLHIMDEKASCDNLSKPEAELKARAYLHTKGIDLNNYLLVASNMDKKENRTDWYWEWEKEGVKESKLRVGVNLKGSEVDGFRRYLKVPGTWEREKMKLTTFSAICSGLIGLLTLAGIVGLLILFGVQLVKRNLVWKTPLIIAILLTVLAILQTFNASNTIFANYPTEISIGNFISQRLISKLIDIAYNFLAIFLVLATGLTLYQKSGYRVLFTREGLFLGVGGGVIGLSLLRILGNIKLNLRLPIRDIPATKLGFVDNYLPSLGIFQSSLFNTLFALGIGLIFVLVLLRYIPSNWMRAIIILALLVVVSGSKTQTTGQFFVALGYNLIILIAVLAFIKYFFKNNLWAYFYALLFMALVPQIILYLRQPAGFFKLNGVVLGLVLILSWLVGFLFSIKRVET